ncbi:endoglucanase [Streptomyces clavuligerus]|nr:endoglucanase [Streptomyces clavuligerus]
MVATLLLAAGLTAAGPARADTPGEATGPTGQKLTVSATADLDPAGQKVTATGSGYDPAKGVYLAVCALPEKAGEAPGPCLGGTDMSGTSGSSYWISNNPPPYAKDLVKPFTVQGGKGGFTFELTVKAKDSGADCTQRACAVVTRADHTHGADREQDVVVPIAFRGGEAPAPAVPPGTVRHDEVRRFPAGGALDIEVDPAAGRLYVGTGGERPLLTTYDTATGERIGAPVELPAAAGALALDAGSRTLHLALGDRIATYDTRTGRVTDHRTPVSPSAVQHLGADPGADLLYVGTRDGTVTVYDTTSWTAVGAPAGLGLPAGALAVDTRTRRAYTVHIGQATDPATGKPGFVNLLHGVDGTTGKRVSTVELGRTALGSRGLAVDAANGTAYVANMAAGTVFTVDLAAGKVTGSTEVGGNPKSLAVDPTTGTLYAGQTTAGTVAVVDTARRRTVQTLETGGGPEALTVDERAHTLYTLSTGTGEVVRSERRISPAVTAQPRRNVSVTAGKQAVFTVAGEGTPAPRIGWEVSSDLGDTWRPVVGAAGAELEFRATAEHDGNRYRAVLSNPVGSTRTASAELSVLAPPGPGGPGGPEDPGTPAVPGRPGGDGGPAGPDGPDRPGGSGDTGGASGGTPGTDGSPGTGGPVDSPVGGGASGGAGDGGPVTHGNLAATGMPLLPFALGAAVLVALGAAALIPRRRVRG